MHLDLTDEQAELLLATLDRFIENDRLRRTSPVAGRPAEGLLTEPRAVARPGARELVFLPHT